jgi:soluble lytic murein transglycosylase-like protein
MAITAKMLCAAIITSSGVFSHGGKHRACSYSKLVIKYSKQYKIDPYLLTALIQVESGWFPHVVSYAGACGLTQVIPKYSRGYTCEQLKNPKTSIRVGAKIFSYWYYKYSKRNKTIALCGYNAGFRCKGKSPNKYGLTYAKKVVKIYNRLQRSK